MVTNPQFKAGVLESRLIRARSSIKPCFYKLGKGGFNPKHPLDSTWDNKQSDCSGFISYLAMTQRAPKSNRPFWIETTAIYNDATGSNQAFTRIDRPVPGCFVVYPDRNGKQGHIGIIEQVFDDTDGTIHAAHPNQTYNTIECASGILGKLGKAIRRRAHAEKLFGAKNAIFVCLKQDLI